MPAVYPIAEGVSFLRANARSSPPRTERGGEIAGYQLGTTRDDRTGSRCTSQRPPFYPGLDPLAKEPIALAIGCRSAAVCVRLADPKAFIDVRGRMLNEL
jgi:hypothetical protein